jgi:hypothetical protein
MHYQKECGCLPAPQISTVINTPMLNHPSFNPIVLLAPVPPSPAWPPKHLDCIQEESLHSQRTLVVGAVEVDDQPSMPIHTTMDIEAPGTQFFIPILMP